jgi:hypothetical protein
MLGTSSLLSWDVLPRSVIRVSVLSIANNVRINVRREKALILSGGKTRPGTGSLHPVAIGAVVEATKLLKPLV